MAVLHSYVVRYDSGFAPNPFYGFCTLATCKPDIRKHAQVGDWIVGTGSKQINRGGHLVYAMQVAETLSFEAYSSDLRFERKKPRLFGSYKMAAGDNIYEPTAVPGRWRQLNSYHSKKDGSPNPDHIKRDTSVSRVLISPVPQFVYFGAEGPLVPHELADAGVVFSGRGRKKITDQAVIADFADWFGSLGVTGYQGRPHRHVKGFEKPKMNTASKSPNVLVSEYQEQVSDTDRFRSEDMTPVLLGLFGEVGSVMSTSKKLQREGSAFVGYQRDVEEELGDALWYLTALCRRVNIPLTDLFDEALQGPGFTKSIAANAEPHRPLSHVISADQISSLDDVLLRLGGHAARLLTIANDRQHARPVLLDFTRVYLEAVQASGVSFVAVLRGNIAKVRGRFLKPDPNHLPDFDRTFPAEEQLPRQFQIEITQRPNGRSYLRWNEVFIGDPLSDNIADPDGYRFHDVFHFANAAILHWSPTFRALVKHKRKSNPKVDEAQDSGRAIVVDEGLSAFIFAHAKSLNFFEGQTSVSFDLLKSVHNFVQGYEVEQCPLKLWEDAILQGYAVFRQMRQHNGGIVVGDRNERTLRFKAL